MQSSYLLCGTHQTLSPVGAQTRNKNKRLLLILSLTVNGLAVLIRMVRTLRGAQEMKKTAEISMRMMLVLLLL